MRFFIAFVLVISLPEPWGYAGLAVHLMLWKVSNQLQAIEYEYYNKTP